MYVCGMGGGGIRWGLSLSVAVASCPSTTILGLHVHHGFYVHLMQRGFHVHLGFHVPNFTLTSAADIRPGC